jgi:hypothetical protein
MKLYLNYILLNFVIVVVDPPHFAQIDFVQSFLTKKLSFCAGAQNDNFKNKNNHFVHLSF